MQGKTVLFFQKKMLKNNSKKTCTYQKLVVLLWHEIIYKKKNAPYFSTRHIPTIKK